MKTNSAGGLAAALLASTMFASAPAHAAHFGISFSTPGVSFSYNSGGYCDDYGCPGRFWDYPVAYCPVFWHGQWYGGPFYYQARHGRTYFWIHDGWRSDDWNLRRPGWACQDRFGPPLDLDFYVWNGF